MLSWIPIWSLAKVEPPINSYGCGTTAPKIQVAFFGKYHSCFRASQIVYILSLFAMVERFYFMTKIFLLLHVEGPCPRLSYIRDACPYKCWSLRFRLVFLCENCPFFITFRKLLISCIWIYGYVVKIYNLNTSWVVCPFIVTYSNSPCVKDSLCMWWYITNR